jgi:DNA-binding MarR family transcriptional regulator
MDPKSLDKVIHERVRLAIMAALAARECLSFNELKELLDLTDGNLSVNARVLEDHGLIRIEKDFVGRKPRTTYAITRQGRKEFEKYIKNLERMIHPKKKK